MQTVRPQCKMGHAININGLTGHQDSWKYHNNQPPNHCIFHTGKGMQTARKLLCQETATHRCAFDGSPSHNKWSSSAICAIFFRSFSKDKNKKNIHVASNIIMVSMSHLISSWYLCHVKYHLAGGWTTHFKNINKSNLILSPRFGVKMQILWNPPSHVTSFLQKNIPCIRKPVCDTSLLRKRSVKPSPLERSMRLQILGAAQKTPRVHWD